MHYGRALGGASARALALSSASSGSVGSRLASGTSVGCGTPYAGTRLNPDGTVTLPAPSVPIELPAVPEGLITTVLPELPPPPALPMALLELPPPAGELPIAALPAPTEELPIALLELPPLAGALPMPALPDVVLPIVPLELVPAVAELLVAAPLERNPLPRGRFELRLRQLTAQPQPSRPRVPGSSKICACETPFS